MAKVRESSGIWEWGRTLPKNRHGEDEIPYSIPAISLPPIDTVRFTAYRLPLHRSWRSASGSIAERQGWLVALQTVDGRTGWGDCAPLPAAGTESLDQAAATLRSLHPWLAGLSPSAALQRLNQQTSCTPSARFGFETALVDLLAQATEIPLAQWLNREALLSVPVNATLGAIDEGLVERAHAALAAGYRVLKIKMGIDPWETEIAALRILAAVLPDGVELRLDANRAWSKSDAQEALEALTELPIESLEEPLTEVDLSTLAHLQQRVPFALALDESLANLIRPRIRREAETSLVVQELVQTCPVRRLVLKPTVLGGLDRTLSIATTACQAGLECVITSTLESSVGIHAVAHSAAALGNSLVHGLATSSWFAQDVAIPPRIEHGRLELEHRPGLGIPEV